MVKELPKLGTWVKADAKVNSIYSCMATDGCDGALMVTHFNDNDDTPAEPVKITFENAKGEKGVKVEYYLLDDDHDAKLVREEIFAAECFALHLDMKLYDTYLIKLIAL